MMDSIPWLGQREAEADGVTILSPEDNLYQRWFCAIMEFPRATRTTEVKHEMSFINT